MYVTRINYYFSSKPGFNFKSYKNLMKQIIPEN